MKEVFLTKKSTFKALSKQITVYDKNQNLFYFFEGCNSRPSFFFNIPEGFYRIKGSFKLLPEYRNQNIELPQVERKIKPAVYKIIYRENPHKATIYYNEKTIVFDHS